MTSVRLQSINAHGKSVIAVALSDDGKHLATYSAEEAKVNFFQVGRLCKFSDQWLDPIYSDLLFIPRHGLIAREAAQISASARYDRRDVHECLSLASCMDIKQVGDADAAKRSRNKGNALLTLITACTQRFNIASMPRSFMQCTVRLSSIVSFPLSL